MKKSQQVDTIVDNLVKPFYKDSELLAKCYYQSLKFYKELESEYSGDEYLKQLEGNAVYHDAWTYQLVSTIASYLCNSGPIRKPLEGTELRLYPNTKYYEISKEATEYHLNFIRNECTGCDFHSRHFQYWVLRDARATKPMKEYIDTVHLFGIRSYFINAITKNIFYKALSRKNYLGIVPETFLSELTPNLELNIEKYGWLIIWRLDHSL